MEQTTELQTTNTQVAAASYQYKSLEEFRIACQNFQNRLNQLPPADSIDKTADGKASTVLISHIEMTLDEFFFGLWNTENFKWTVVANEILGSLDLVAVHPVSGRDIRRVGAAAIQIMVDATPDELKEQQTDSPEVKKKKKIERNKWALNPDNKKSGALDMGFPKLKAECLKNAAQSFGQLFGRDLNRKKSDKFKPLITPVLLQELVALLELKKEALSDEELKYAQRIIENEETASYAK
jgi:hypothetical protein